MSLKINFETFSKLDENSKFSIKHYTKLAYKSINDYCNGKSDGSELFTTFEKDMSIKEMADNIDQSMNIHELKQDIISFRGASGRHYDKFKIGDQFEETQFISTSLTKETPTAFLKKKKDPTFIEYKIPKGTKCIYFGKKYISE